MTMENLTGYVKNQMLTLANLADGLPLRFKGPRWQNLVFYAFKCSEIILWFLVLLVIY